MVGKVGDLGGSSKAAESASPDDAGRAPSAQQAWEAAVRQAKASTPSPESQVPPAAPPGAAPKPPPLEATPPAPAPQAAAQWTPESKQQVDALIDGAMQRHGGDVELAFADLRDQRQQPPNYYDTNMAIAADYLRARLETQKVGPDVALGEVETYMALKRNGGVPQEGPGPVSPYSDLELEEMRRGVADGEASMPLAQQLLWRLPISEAYGEVRAGLRQSGIG